MEKEYFVTIDVGSLEIFVMAKNKEEAKKKAIKEIEEDMNYFHELDFYVEDENVQQSDDFDDFIDDIIGGV